MANITAGQVLEQVDALVPNQYTHSEKLRWLAQAEGFVLREVCRVTGKLAELEDGSVRCPQLRLRLEGHGNCRIYSVSAVYEKGSDLP